MNREITFSKHESLLVGYFHWVKMHRNLIVCICTMESLQDATGVCRRFGWVSFQKRSSRFFTGDPALSRFLHGTQHTIVRNDIYLCQVMAQQE